MGLPLKYYKWLRNIFMTACILSPVAGYLYIESSMKRMEKGIDDDLKRIASKGKTLSDIPRKN